MTTNPPPPAIHIAPLALRDYFAARPRVLVTTGQVAARLGWDLDMTAGMLRVLAQDRQFGELEERTDGWMFRPAEETLALVPERGGSGDEHDLAAARVMLAAFDLRPGLRCGDWLEFPDGQLRRAAIAERDEDGDLSLVQPGHDGCSYHLSRTGVSMGNGALYWSVPPDAITPTARTRPGDFWFSGGHGAVTGTALYRVFNCSADLPAA